MIKKDNWKVEMILFHFYTFFSSTLTMRKLFPSHFHSQFEYIQRYPPCLPPPNTHFNTFIYKTNSFKFLQVTILKFTLNFPFRYSSIKPHQPASTHFHVNEFMGNWTVDGKRKAKNERVDAPFIFVGRVSPTALSTSELLFELFICEKK